MKSLYMTFTSPCALAPICPGVCNIMVRVAQNGIGHRALKYMKIRGNSINILYLEGATNEIKENKKFPCLTLIMMNINNHNL